MSEADVVVIGGGPAGLSGAIALGRARRSVIVVDSGKPRNAVAAGVHVFLGHDGIAPHELSAKGRSEATKYGVQFAEDTVTQVDRVDGVFNVTLASGASIRAKRLLLASGVRDELPDVKGIREQWGKNVMHCPYCHGWEHQDEPIGIIARNAMAAHQAQMFRQWSDDIVLFMHEAPPLQEEQREQLVARGIRIVDGRITEVVTEGDDIVGVRLEDGIVIERRAIAIATYMTVDVSAFDGLGLKVVPHSSGLGEQVEADANGVTSVAGVWAAGNVTNLAAQVVTSAAAGTWAGAQVNADLIAEEIREAVATYRPGA